MHSRLAIDTTVGMTAGPSSAKSRFRDKRSVSPMPGSPGPSGVARRGRSVSNASTTSSLSIISPNSSSTNASTTSLNIPTATQHYNRSRSVSPVLEETVRLGSEYVLAMHDYAPQHQSATCLSFRAGQVIHVLNRDASGWWDGELEGRRGWFPSNYVNTEVTSLTEEQPLDQAVSSLVYFNIDLYSVNYSEDVGMLTTAPQLPQLPGPALRQAIITTTVAIPQYPKISARTRTLTHIALP